MKTLLIASFILLLGAVHGQLDVANVENIEDSVLREKCNERGGKGTYDKVLTARENLQKCIEDLVDIDTLKKEIDESKKTGSMDEVFGKYCRKRPQLRSCVDKFLESVKLCLIEDEKKNLNNVLDVLKELGEFACYKDGDRIAMFVAEQGPECIKAHVEGIKTCVNNTLKISPSNSFESLPSFLNATKICDDMAKVQPCIVTELEKCDNTTPANVVDSVFRFIRKRACKKTNKRRRSVISKRSIGTSPVHIKNMLNAYVKYTQFKCKSKGKQELLELTQSLIKTQKCVTDYMRSNILILLSPEDIKMKVIECSEDFIQASENCLPENEKYYPRFSQEIMSGMVDLGFKYRKNLTTSSWTPEVQSCFQSFKHDTNRQSILDCFNENREMLLSEKGYTKKYVCERLSRASKCVTNTITSVCVPDAAVDKFTEELEEVFSKPCEDVDEF